MEGGGSGNMGTPERPPAGKDDPAPSPRRATIAGLPGPLQDRFPSALSVDAPALSSPLGGQRRRTRLMSHHTHASAFSVRSTVLRAGDAYMGDDAATTVQQRLSTKLGTAVSGPAESGGGVLAAAGHWVRVVLSGVFMLFCITFTGAAICTGVTTMWNGVPNGVTLAIAIALVFWLAVLEASQVPIISLARGDSARVAALQATHPRAFRACGLCHGGGRLERYLLGREFLKLLVYFMLAKATKLRASKDAPLGLPGAFAALGHTGLLASHFIVVLGQLVGQMAAARCPVAFLDLPVLIPVAIRPALAVEATGIVHVAYLVKGLIDRAAGEQSAGEGRSRCGRLLRAARCCFSLFAWGFGCAAVMTLLWRGWDNGPFGVSGAAGVALFVALWFVLSFLDGLQVAATAAAALDQGQLSARAVSNAELVGPPAGLQSYFIGKQLLSAVVRFMLISMATCRQSSSREGTVFGMPQGLQEGLLETGVLGAVVIVVGPLIARLIAATFPGAYLGVPLLTQFHIELCFFVDTLGIVHCCWPLSDLLCALLGLGTARGSTAPQHCREEAQPLRDLEQPCDTAVPGCDDLVP
eukprot:TRINITY_DN70783_c0_g1_i1.p1 TRINITY_DN70783_c0_g1~~TRINITY_DN70783_c0_g1_i1.p1  ORF type:complete len:605 (+),score=193.68 TRINITY_DN70783_c0_g1_i1:69-1817(+)